MEKINEITDIILAATEKWHNSLYSLLDIEGFRFIEGLEQQHGCNIVAKWRDDGDLEMICVNEVGFQTYYFQHKDKRSCNKVVVNTETWDVSVVKC